MIVTVASTKGGVGKTTLAVGLAEALAVDGAAVVLLDLDAQAEGSSDDWAELAGDDLAVTVATATAVEMTRALPKIAADHIVIDTPPADPAATAAAIEAADLVLVASGPRSADVRSAVRVLHVAADTNTPVAVTLTMTRSGVAAADATRQALTDLGWAVTEATIPMRERIHQSFGNGLTPAVLAPFAALAVEITATYTKEP